MTALEPCPYCASTSGVANPSLGAMVCTACGASGPVVRSKGLYGQARFVEMAANWNRRDLTVTLRRDRELILAALEMLLEQPASPGGDPEILEVIARRKLARELVSTIKRTK